MPSRAARRAGCPGLLRPRPGWATRARLAGQCRRRGGDPSAGSSPSVRARLGQEPRRPRPPSGRAPLRQDIPSGAAWAWSPPQSGAPSALASARALLSQAPPQGPPQGPPQPGAPLAGTPSAPASARISPQSGPPRAWPGCAVWWRFAAPRLQGFTLPSAALRCLCRPAAAPVLPTVLPWLAWGVCAPISPRMRRCCLHRTPLHTAAIPRDGWIQLAQECRAKAEVKTMATILDAPMKTFFSTGKHKSSAFALHICFFI